MTLARFASHIAISFLLFSFPACNRIENSNDWCKLRNKNNNEDIKCFYSRAEIPVTPLTLDDAIYIALDQNLSLLVKQHEYCIQKEVVTREKLNMIPKLILNWENSGRNENTASFSESLQPGIPPAPLSISSEQNIMRWDITAVWGLVDFGVSYFRSRQEYNKVLIAQLEYERLRQNLVVDVTKQFWKAVVAKIALRKSIEVVDKALDQQASLHRQIDSKIISEIQGLRNENQLINIRGQLQAYSAEYHNAKSELALLMGIPATYQYELADIECMGVDVNICDVKDLEQYALVNRPELFSADAEEQIRVEEARAAIVQMLPGVELFGGPFHDSNKYLLYSNWLSAGLRATWNLLNVPAYNKERQIACMRKQLARSNRIALAAGVIAQVHLSYILFFDNLQSYGIAKELESVNKRLLHAAKSEQKQGKLHEADILKYEAESLFAEIDANTKYANLQNTLAQLNSAIGLPRYFRTDIEYRSLDNSHNSCQEVRPTEQDMNLETEWNLQ